MDKSHFSLCDEIYPRSKMLLTFFVLGSKPLRYFSIILLADSDVNACFVAMVRL
jgi:hypothetical protein